MGMDALGVGCVRARKFYGRVTGEEEYKEEGWARAILFHRTRQAVESYTYNTNW